MVIFWKYLVGFRTLKDVWSESGPESDQKFSKVCGQQGPGLISLVKVNSQLRLSLLGQQAAACC